MYEGTLTRQEKVHKISGPLREGGHACLTLKRLLSGLPPESRSLLIESFRFEDEEEI